jgi:hypothetical protein
MASHVSSPADQHRRPVERRGVQRPAMALRGDAGSSGADRRRDHAQHRAALRTVDAQPIAEQRRDTDEGEQRAGELAGRDAITGDVDVGERDRRQWQRGEQDRGQAAVDVLLAPIDQPIVSGEQHEPNPGDEQPLGAAAWPARVEHRHQRRHDQSRQRKAPRGNRERSKPAVAHFDHHPGRAPDEAQQDIRGHAERVALVHRRLHASHALILSRRSRENVGSTTRLTVTSTV